MGIKQRLTVVSQGENAIALLHQLMELQQQLLKDDQPSVIDLRAMPLSRWDRERLRDLLGEGGVSAVVEDEEEGRLEVLQSAIGGIWWLQRLDDEDNVLGEFIEVSYCPEALLSAVEDVEDGLEVLRARLLASEYLER